ncbi:MAG TPA: hypothetical protein VM285_02985 [Polyangia bacterium]|nr:hypothetical protein [Thermoleophilia bacterium]HUT76621.1 hypothetical protein [Polyangia bacterium]
MAERVSTITKSDRFAEDVRTVLWSGLTNATSDTGEPFPMASAADRSVQVKGTFGAGGTAVIEGSNDGITYATLNDPALAPLSFNAAGLRQVTELPLWIRPRITAGDGTTDLEVILLVRRGK